MAVMCRRGSILRQLHVLGISTSIPNDQSETILHLACSQGLDGMVLTLLSLGMDLNQMTTPGPPGPRQRIRHGDIALSETAPDPIMHRPASSLGFRARDKEGFTTPFGTEEERKYPIYLAIAPGKSIACVRALMEHEADSNVRTSSGATALQLSFEMGDETGDIVELLLSREADPNALISMGRTMLHLAAAMGLDESYLYWLLLART